MSLLIYFRTQTKCFVFYQMNCVKNEVKYIYPNNQTHFLLVKTSAWNHLNVISIEQDELLIYHDALKLKALNSNATAF